MIDTDKYEGHTPAPWIADDDGGYGPIGKHLHIDAYGEEGDVCVARMVNGNWIDTQLIADAPLLLAEVKRLSEAIADIANNMEAVDEHYKTDVSYAELAKMSGFIEDLRKVIE